MAKYLNRDDVLNVIDYIRTKYISVYNRRDKCSQFWADTIRYFEKRINKLGDCDVAPVRHGHWINENFYTRCSVCGNMAIYDKYGQEVESDYCPRCGAKMHSERKEILCEE